MKKTEYIIGETYEIVKIGKKTAWYLQRDEIIGKQIVLTEIDELPKYEGGYGMFCGTFVESFNYTDEDGKKQYKEKGDEFYSPRVKLKMLKVEST